MPVLDQIETYGRQEFTGSYTDDVYFGNIFQITSSLSGGFVREKIASALEQNVNPNVFDRKNLTYIQRLKYVSGSIIQSSLKNRILPVFSIDEQFYDSFMPNPVDIAQINGITFPFIGDSGSLQGSSLHGVPGAPNNSVSLFLSNVATFTINQSSPILNEIVDFDWSISKWPFRKKYSNLRRIFNPSIKLPSSVQQTKTFTGTTLTPVSRSNNLGSVYYVTDRRIKMLFPFFLSGISSSLGFNLTHLPVPGSGSGVPQTYNIDACVSPDPITGEKTPIYMAVGGTAPTFVDGVILSGSFLYKSADGLGAYWENITPQNLLDTYPQAHLRGVAHAVSDTTPDPWIAWAVVGSNGIIFVNTTARNATKSNWVDRTGATSNTLFGVAFNDPFGSFATANFAAVGTSGVVVTSSNKTGTSWTQVGASAKPNTKDLYAITYNVATNRFIAVGYTTIWRSTDRLGTSWTEVLAPAAQFFGVATGTTSTVIAVGDDGLSTGFIYRSANGGANWTDVSPGGLGNLIGVAVGNPDDDIDWIAVGTAGRVWISRDDGLTWERNDAAGINVAIESYDLLRTIRAASIDAEANALVGLPRYVAAGNSRTLDRNIIFRSTDLISNQYFTGSNGQLKNEIVTIRKEGTKFGRGQGVTVVATDLAEFYKDYFGNASGIEIDLTEQQPYLYYQPFANKYLNNRSPNYFDHTIYNPSSLQGSIESIRVHGSKLRGWGYGVYSALPMSTKAIWRRGRYGQFRDLLEQRPFSKLFKPTTEISKHAIIEGPVKIRFVSGSVAGIIAVVSTSLNPTDSGQFDFEYKSGQPFFDNIDLSQYR